MKQKPFLFPKLTNQDRGYFFDVTDQQIEEHLNRSVADIFSWLEHANQFIFEMQTPIERDRSKTSKTIFNKVS